MATSLAIALWLLAGCRHEVPPVSAPTREPALPADARSWYLRAQVADAIGDAAEADRATAWLVRVARDDPAAWRVRVAWLVDAGRSLESVEVARSGLATVGDDPELMAAWGMALLSVERRDEGHDALWRAARAGSWSAHALLATEASVDASAVLASWLELPGPPEPAAGLNRARLALELERPERALPDLERAATALGAGPDVAVAWVEAADAACQIGAPWAWAEERGAWRGAGWESLALTLGVAARDPRMVAVGASVAEARGVELQAAELLIAGGLYERALALVREVRPRQPGRAGVLWALEARALEGAGRPEAAAIAWERASSPESAASPHADRCGVEAALADLVGVDCPPAAALRRLELAAPADVGVLDRLATAYDACGMTDSALDTRRRAAVLVPTSARRALVERP